MTPARIKHLAAQCADQLLDGDDEWAGVIEAAIRGALDEALSPDGWTVAMMRVSAARLDRGSKAEYFAAMLAEKRKDWAR